LRTTSQWSASLLSETKTTERVGSKRLKSFGGSYRPLEPCATISKETPHLSSTELSGSTSECSMTLIARERQQSDGAVGPGQDFGRDKDNEEPPDEDRAPAIRGHVEDADSHGPRKRRAIDSLMPFRVWKRPDPSSRPQANPGGSPRVRPRSGLHERAV
jgi:hypothetical protein